MRFSLMLSVTGLLSLNLLTGVPVFAVASITLPFGFEAKEILTGLSNPTDIAFSPDGRWFISERAGKIRVVENGLLLKEPLLDITDHVSAFQDGGLLSIALDPDIQQNGYIYLLYSYRNTGTEMSDPQTSRLTRIKLDPVTDNVMTTQVDPPETILLGSISTPYDRGQNNICKAGSDCIPFDDGNHAADNILFVQDKTMFVSMGDGSSAEHIDERALRSQDKNWMSGKVLHIDRDGNGLATNPFWNGDPKAPISKVYYYGLRNPYRLTLHPEFGLFIADVGLNKWEEINYSPRAGANFGWPCYEGDAVRAGYSSDPDTKSVCDLLYTHPESATAPLFAYPHPNPDTGAAIIGGAFYFGKHYPLGFQGNYFFADLIGGYMKRVILDSDGKLLSTEDFASNLPIGTTKVFSFPDGDLGLVSYYVGKIFRISYTADNRPPVAIASADLTYGAQMPFEVQFGGENSFDPDGDKLNYSWDFGDGTSEISTPSPKHVFSEAGKFTVTLTVENDKKLKSTAVIPVYAGDTPPDVTITSPSNGTSFDDGGRVSFSANASDSQDGDSLGGQAKWKLILHHQNHIHEIPIDSTGLSGNITATYHDEDTSYELEVIVSDSLGMTTKKSVFFDVTYDSKYSYGPSLLLIGGNYYEIPSGPSLQLYKFSASAWFKTNKDDGATSYIVNKGGGGLETPGSNQNYGIWMNGNEQIVGGFESSDGVNHFVASPGRYNDSKWHYAAVTADGARTVLYVDGLQVATIPAKEQPDTTTNPLIIGANSYPLGGFFKGNVDEIRLWDRALTPVEVADQYNKGIFNTSSQILYLPFDESSNTLIPQDVGLGSYGINASLTNGAITGFRIDPDSNSIILQINTGLANSEALLDIVLPRSLIDSRNGTSDADFVVLGGDDIIQHHEVPSSGNVRELEFVVPDGASEVEIVGTQVMPELPASVLAVIAAGTIGSVALVQRKWRE